LITTISNSNLIAIINHLGAELISLRTKENKEYIWEGNPEFWGKHSPILFPIVGTLKNNTYLFNGVEYHLSRHGFARDMKFELIEIKDSSATFSIQNSKETLKIYPFEFELQICYSLDENKLNIDYKVINKNNFIMPFSIGAHPAFALSRNFENYYIALEQEETLEYYLLENDLVSNTTKKLEANPKRIPLNYELFDNDALIFKYIKSSYLTLLENSKPMIKVYIEDFPNLGIWTKKNAPFLCIEPWFGYSDTEENSGNIFEKEGIQILEGNKTFNSKFSIEIL
jgi:galactose mutarotase-like enzyme